MRSASSLAVRATCTVPLVYFRDPGADLLGRIVHSSRLVDDSPANGRTLRVRFVR